MATGEEFAHQAESEIYTGVPYDKLDCQGFVEKVLADLGIRNSSGKPYNWKGSNFFLFRKKTITGPLSLKAIIASFSSIFFPVFLFLIFESKVILI